MIGRQFNAKHPALLRHSELEALTTLAKNANARIYIGFDIYVAAEAAKKEYLLQIDTNWATFTFVREHFRPAFPK